MTVTESSLDRSDPLQECPIEWAANFHTAVSSTLGRTTVRAYGEIDLVTGGSFRSALTVGLDRQPPLLVVDLGRVSFLDAYGLGILVGTANQAARVGVPITVIGARPHIYRLFDLTGLVHRLDVHPLPPVCLRIPNQ